MSKANVVIDYTKEVDNDLDNFAQGVYNSLISNTNFRWDATVMPSFLTNITAYRTRLEAAQNGTSKDTTAKNVARLVLTDQLRIIAMEVNRQSAGDIIKLQSSGLRPVKEKTKKGVLPKPSGFKVTTGINSGELQCIVDANTDAGIYYFYSAPTPASANIFDWRLTPSTTRKKSIPGYTPGKQYELKCAYKGAEDTLIYSDSILIYAQ